MDKLSILNEPFFWAIVLLSAALLIIWTKRRQEEEDGDTVVLFPFAERNEIIESVENQYIHFGVNRDRNFHGPYANNERIECEDGSTISCITESCTCNENPQIFVNLRTLTGNNIPTESGSPPRSTISNPTGTGSAGGESLSINVWCNNQYVPITNIFDYLPYLPDRYINFSNTNQISELNHKIAIIDTGLVSRNNNPSFTSKFFSGVREVCSRFSNTDTDGHGTAVYYFLKVGLAARNITNYEIYPYNVADESGRINLGRALCAMVDAAERGVKTINLSFGFYEHMDQLEYFFRLFFQTYNGIKVICSAGNYNLNILPFTNNAPVPSPQMPHPPSYYHALFQDNIFQITGLDRLVSDNGITGVICPFTNYNNEYNFGCQGSYTLNLNNQNCRLDGTSFASPYFAGYFTDLAPYQLADALEAIRANIPPVGQHNHHTIVPFSTYIP